MDTAFGLPPAALLDLSTSGLGRRSGADRNWKVAPESQDPGPTVYFDPYYYWQTHYTGGYSIQTYHSTTHTTAAVSAPAPAPRAPVHSSAPRHTTSGRTR